MGAKRNFYFDPSKIVSVYDGIDKYIADAILENNNEFSTYFDNIRMVQVVRCETKPKNLFASGVIWKEDGESHGR